MVDVAAYNPIKIVAVRSASLEGEWLRVTLEEDVSTVIRILHRGYPVSGFEIDSLRDIRIPLGATDISVDNLRVHALVRTEDGIPRIVSIGFGNSVRTIDAVDEAVQRMFRFLLRKPNSDPWNPSGGNLQELTQYSYTKAEDIAPYVDEAVRRYNSSTVGKSGEAYVSKVSVSRVAIESAQRVQTILSGAYLQSDSYRSVLFIQLRSKIRYRGTTLTVESALPL